jgi:hypothetical protein
MKSPEFAGQTEFYGSSAFKSFFPEARQGGDIDARQFQSQEQLDRFANSMATNANKLSGTNNYVVKEGDVFNNKGKLTDLHFKDKMLDTIDPSSSGANSSFGLKTKSTLTVDTVKVMDPTQLTIQKGSSALTPREFETLTSSDLTTTKTQNPKAFKDNPDLENIMKYHVNNGKEIGFDHELYYGSAPANYRGKDVTDFLGQGKILNERYMGGKQTDRIDNLIDLYTKKGYTTPEKVNAAAGQIAKGDTSKLMEDYQTLLPKTEKSSPSFSSPSSMLTSGGFASRLSMFNSNFNIKNPISSQERSQRTTAKYPSSVTSPITSSLSFSPINQKSSLTSQQKVTPTKDPYFSTPTYPRIQTRTQQARATPATGGGPTYPIFTKVTNPNTARANPATGGGPTYPAFTKSPSYITYPEPGPHYPTYPKMYPEDTSKPKPSTPDFFNPPGGLSGEHGSGMYDPSKFIGQRSIKRVYNTATAEDFWG